MSTKRILSLVLTLTLILGTFSFAFADTAKPKLTTDQKIEKLVDLGFIQGTGGGNLDLRGKLTRAQTATIIARAIASNGDISLAKAEEIIKGYRAESKFSDVPVSEWYNTYINYSEKKGIVQGYPNGTFKPGNDISYAEVITMMVRMSDEKYTDLAGQWPKNYIEKADELNLLNGVYVDYTTSAIRGVVFELLYNTLDEKGIIEKLEKEEKLEVESVSAINANKIGVKFKDVATAVMIDLDKALVEGANEVTFTYEGNEYTVTVNYREVESVSAISATKIGVKFKGIETAVMIDLDKALVNGANTVTFTYNGKTYTETVNYDAPLAVESVSAINGKQLEVKFNNAVEKSSVIDASDDLETGVVDLTRTSTDSPANVIGTGNLNGQSATLSEDGKVLTITLDTTNQYFKGNYDVKVSNAVKKGTADKMENYYGKFVANDTVAPKVTEVTYNVVTDNFEIKLSKPVDSLAGEVVRINGQPQSLAAISAPTDKLTVARPGEVEPGTTANIYLAGIEDAAGNLMNSYTGNVVVQKDTAALAVNGVEQIQNQKVRVTFNKKLDSASDSKIKGTVATNGLVVIKSDGSTTTNYSVAAAPAAENPNDNKYDITLTDATYANGNTENFTITFVEDAFKGVSGTKNKVFTKSITLTKDTVKPVVKSTKVALDKESIEVTLDKAIQTVTQANVKLRRNGAELTSVTATLKSGTNNVVVVKTTDATAVTASKLNAGTYQVRLEEGAVTDLNGNINATTNAPTVTVSGDTTVDPAKATIADGTGDNVFTITAPGTEKFATSSLNYTNFVLDGNVIPANSDITLNPARTVITVKLPAKNTVNISGAALLKASNLAFESGNPYAISTGTVTVADNTPATMNSARLVGNVVELTFDEAINASTISDIDELLADFTIKSDAGTFAKASIASPGPGTVASATVAQGSNDKKIIITITGADSNWSTVAAGTNLTITSIENASTGQVTNLQDANGVEVKAPVKVNVTK